MTDPENIPLGSMLLLVDLPEKALSDLAKLCSRRNIMLGEQVINRPVTVATFISSSKVVLASSIFPSLAAK
jgi:hypothetical protein